MNERIKLLADEAKMSTYLLAYGVEFNISIEKFAELIVRDCMDVVDGYTKPRTFNTHYDAVEQIEALFGIKHFGVEE
jgi:hypothetical protein